MAREESRQETPTESRLLREEQGRGTRQTQSGSNGSWASCVSPETPGSQSSLVRKTEGQMTEYVLSGEVKNATTGEVMKITVQLQLAAVKSNAPPQYTGPTTILDLVVGVARPLQFMDP